MIWSTWRQFRGTILTAVSLPLLLALVTVVATVAVGGLPPVGTYYTCFGYSSNECVAQSIATIVSSVTLVLPVVLGLFVGVTVFSRDVERRTHVLGLTQAISRRRWYWTRLLVVFVPTILAVVVLGYALFWSQYLSFSGSFGFAGTYDSRLEFPMFSGTGLAPAGYTALGLTVGSTAALLLRNTIGAMVVTLIVSIAALVAFPILLRPHYAAAEVEVIALEDTSYGGYSRSSGFSTELRLYPRWVVGSGYIDTDGRPVDVPPELCASRQDPWSEARDDETTAQYEARLDAQYTESSRIRVECLRENGIDHFEERYHEDSRFWRFQLTETALSVLAAALFSAGSMGLVRRLRP